jgi:TolB-like protein/Flp pilus assembly protein TadD
MADLLNGEFELGKRLGGGAEGEVYEAVAVKTNMKVAIKMIKRLHQDADLLESIKKLKGNYLNSCAAVLDVFELDGKIITVLELLNGVCLRESLASNSWSLKKRQGLALDLIHCVKDLHVEGLAHGDLSPDNVFVSGDGKIRLIDPRIATKQSAGAVLGTANYAAPEMLLFGSLGNACGDVFSLSALIYEIFEGRDAFGCQSPEEYILKAGTKSLVARPFDKTPANFRSLITAGLEFDPRARPKTVERLLGLLETHSRRKRIAALTGGLVLAALLIAGVWHLRSTRAGMDSIAVLPFVNENNDPETEYLSDGLTESIINELAQLPSLRVSPRGMVFRYRGGTADPVRVARDLGVRAVVTGRLLRRGENLLVSVELLDVQENKQVWGERYDRKTSAALAVQQEISHKIFESLRAKMTATAQRRLTTRGTENPEAYQAYLKGRYYWNRRTAGNIGKALQQFQQAVDADPAYAPAYIGLADCYAVLPQYAGVSMNDTIPKARAAAVRALEIDDSLSEAHASLGYIDMMSWQFKEADKEFRRAIDLDPNYSTAHMWYGTFLHVMGRPVEAVAESRWAQQLDPLSPINETLACNIHLVTGDIATGIDECKKVLEIDEKFPRAHDLLGWAYLKQGRAPEALAELAKATEASGRESQELGYLGYGYGVLNRRAEAQAVLKELESRYAKRQSPGMFLAAVYAGLGDKNKAFNWLEKDFQARNGVLVYITYFPVYDTLRDDPRYADLLRRVGIR